MRSTIVRLVLIPALIVCPNAFAFAQASATSAISGVVVDSAGGAIPGANVVVTNAAGATFETVTNEVGVFRVPALSAGVYNVTVSLAGFKTALVPAVRVVPGVPADLKVVLEIGQLEETIMVTASSEIINTQTATVSATLNVDQITRMPTPTRNALNAVTFLPGVNTATTNRNSNINGLPDSFVNVTLDGVSNSDNFLRSSDAFFASVTPRQDAIEAVTVTSAVGGSDVGGSGAVVINFVTRSGSNKFSGSVYEYWRHPSLNTNYWFNERNNLPKNDVKLNQYGGRAGGPIVIPGVVDGRGKAFFFVNYEQLRFPNSFTRTRTMLNPRALDGWFRYQFGNEVREVNVLSLATANGQIASVNPTVRRLLNDIQAAAQTKGTISQSSDPLLMDYVWQSPGRLFEHQPTIRLDYNITDNHRLGGSYQVIWAERDPDYLNAVDARFPGAPNYRYFHSKRPLTSVSLRSAFSSNLVNELRGGITAKGGASYFGDESSNGPQTFEDQDGFAIDFDANIGLTNWWATNTPSWRAVPTYSIDDNVSWQKGTHSLNFGGSMLFSGGWENAQQMVPGINLRFDTVRDPAAFLFSSTNFPGATAANLTDARELYSLLTGRVGAVTSQAALDPETNKYVELGARTRAGTIDMYSLFVQDSWRVSPTLTLNGGLRWDVQLPFTPTNDIMSTASMEDVCGISGLGEGGLYSKCNFFQPGASGGKTPEFVQYTAGTRGYNTDWNNIAPSVSLAWRPDVQEGWLRTLLGDPGQATIRGGYSVAYERQGLGVFTGQYGTNPGSTIDLTRSADSGDPLVPPGQSWPVLLSEKNRLYSASFNEDPSFPIPVLPNRGSTIDTFAPEIVIASARSWTVGFQRALSAHAAVEIRYVGTRGVNQWSELDYNLIRGESLQNNGFLNEFKLAMANLVANNASGVSSRRGSFAYFGEGTGTSPLPIYLGYLNGRTDATNPAAYTGGTTTWTSSTLASRLVPSNPAPVTSAQDLDGNSARRSNAVSAGLPRNFFVPNPDVSNNRVYDSGAFSSYHALQIELRRRMSRGLAFNVNYQYAVEGGSSFDGFTFGRVMTPSENVRHAIKTQWDWTIPVGRGQRYGANLNPALDAIVGGWSFNGVGRIQQRYIDFGNVRLVGMTKADLQKMYKHEIRTDPASGLPTVYMLPDDVILNTRRAFNISTTTVTGYSEALGPPEGRYIAPPNSPDCLQIRAGDCAPRSSMMIAPWFVRFDVGVTKRFPIHGNMNVEVRFDLLNLFDNINFDPFVPSTTTTSSAYYGAPTFALVNSAYQDPSNTFDPGGRLGQIMLRFNW